MARHAAMAYSPNLPWSVLLQPRARASSRLVVLEIRLLVLAGGSERIDQSDIENPAANGALVFLRECRRGGESLKALAVEEIRDGGQRGQFRPQLVLVA